MQAWEIWSHDDVRWIDNRQMGEGGGEGGREGGQFPTIILFHFYPSLAL